jgi:hypothetical protein
MESTATRCTHLVSRFVGTACRFELQKAAASRTIPEGASNTQAVHGNAQLASRSVLLVQVRMHSPVTTRVQRSDA